MILIRTKWRKSSQIGKCSEGSLEIVSGQGVFNDNRRLSLLLGHSFVQGISSDLLTRATGQEKNDVTFDPFGRSRETALIIE